MQKRSWYQVLKKYLQTNAQKESDKKRIILLILISLQSFLLFSQGLGNEMYQLSQLKNKVKSRLVNNYEVMKNESNEEIRSVVI
jgi:hypothetical protein